MDGWMDGWIDRGDLIHRKPRSDDVGHDLGSLAIACSFCLSRKRQFQGSLGMLVMAFSPCLSRKRHFQGPTRRPKSGPSWTTPDDSLGPSDRHFTLRVREMANCKPL